MSTLFSVNTWCSSMCVHLFLIFELNLTRISGIRMTMEFSYCGVLLLVGGVIDGLSPDDNYVRN